VIANAAGCDSTITLTLTVNPTSSSAFSQAICQGDSFLFDGVYRKTAGTYSRVIANAAGCDSTITLTLTVNPTSSSAFSQAICQGDSFLFNGVFRKTAGTYSRVIANAAGCDSTITLTLTVNPTSSSAFSQAICQGDSFLFNGAYRKIAGTYSRVIANAAGCDSTITLTLTVKPTSSSAFSQAICQGDSFLFNGVFRKTAGTYSRVIANAAGCDSTITLTLTVKPTSSSAFSQAICQGDSLLFNGVYRKIAGTYSRVIANAAGCDSTITLTLTVKPTSSSAFSQSICQGDSFLFNGVYRKIAGTYSRVIANAAGCDSTITLTLTVKPTSSSAFSQAICQGDSFLFNGVYRKTAGTYSRVIANAAGCDSTITLTLTVKPTSSSAFSQAICQGDSFLFNGVYRKTAGTYSRVIANAAGCDSTITLTLTVKPTSSSAFSQAICQGDSFLFNGVYRKIAGTYSRVIANAAGCDSTITLTLTVKPTSSSAFSQAICQGDSFLFNGVYRKTAGTYTRKVTNAAGCDSTITLTLTVKPTSSSAFSQAICQGDSFLFNGVFRKTAGTYSRKVTNAAGCDSTITLTLTVKATSSFGFTQTIATGDSFLFNGAYRKTAGTYTMRLTNSVGCDSIVTLTLVVITCNTYSLLANDDIHLHNNTVYGNVGVWGANKKARIEKSTSVYGFVTAPIIDLLDGSTISGAQTTAQAPAPANNFKYNTRPDTATSYTIPDNYSGVYNLSGNVFKNISVGKNSILNFTSSGDIYVREFTTKDADNGKFTQVRFTGNTNLIIKKKLTLGKRTKFNQQGSYDVNVFVEDYDVSIKEASTVTADIDVRFKTLNVSGSSSNPVVMNGSYIGFKIDATYYVTWNGSGCQPSARMVRNNTTTNEEFNVSVYPNPTNGDFNILVNSTSDATGRATIYDATGRKIADYHDIKANTIYPVSQNMAKGMYLIRVEQNGTTQTTHLINE
jgi:hypothetical protein